MCELIEFSLLFGFNAGKIIRRGGGPKAMGPGEKSGRKPLRKRFPSPMTNFVFHPGAEGNSLPISSPCRVGRL